jgi:hypothetical protein
VGDRAETAEDRGLDLTEVIAEEREFRKLLDGRRVIAYHCTRLFEHEEAAIRRDGLRPVSLAGMRERIRSAHEHGHLTEGQQDDLLAAAERADSQTVESRGSGVFLVVGQGDFIEFPDLVSEWLGFWGGTVIYESAGARRGEPHWLGGLGRPTIVVAALEIIHERFRQTDYLGQMFSAVAHGHPWLGSEVRYGPLVPDECIDALLHPGDCRYDRYSGLPRS